MMVAVGEELRSFARYDMYSGGGGPLSRDTLPIQNQPCCVPNYR